MKKIATIVSVLLLLIAIASGVIYYLMSTVELLAKTQQAENVTWFDDYYTLESIDKWTIAIGEPRYFQKNYNYLIVGRDRAILFDTGPGIRNIRPVIESLTTLPVTVISSHLHYDHIGNHDQFDNIAMLDIEETNPRLQKTMFSPTYWEHIGFIEGITKPRFTIAETLQAKQIIDLGGRTLQVLHTPGHTADSLMLLDRERNLLFSGDFIYEGTLFAFLPGSDLGDYYKSTQQLLSVTTEDTVLLAAHSGTSPSSLPFLERKNLVDLNKVLASALAGEIEGEGVVFKTYTVNDLMSIISF